jgi:hypothetical protein
VAHYPTVGKQNALGLALADNDKRQWPSQWPTFILLKKKNLSALAHIVKKVVSGSLSFSTLKKNIVESTLEKKNQPQSSPTVEAAHVHVPVSE